MPFPEHRARLRYFQRRNYALLWSWTARPISLRRYTASLLGAYRRWELYFRDIDPSRAREYRRLIELVETARSIIEEFHTRLETHRAKVITEKNIIELKRELLNLKEEELTYVKGITWIDLTWYGERFSKIIEALERLIFIEVPPRLKIELLITYPIEHHYTIDVGSLKELREALEKARESVRLRLGYVPVSEEDAKRLRAEGKEVFQKTDKKGRRVWIWKRWSDRRWSEISKRITIEFLSAEDERKYNEWVRAMEELEKEK